MLELAAAQALAHGIESSGYRTQIADLTRAQLQQVADLEAVAKKLTGERDAAHVGAVAYARQWTEASQRVDALLDADRARQQADADAEAARAQQAAQRATDLETYRTYLYEQMPAVCRRAGLDPAHIDPAWDLSATGKLNDVLFHLSTLDRRGHPLALLGDVIDLFVGAA